VDALGEDEARFAFLRFASSEKNRLDVGLLRCRLFNGSLGGGLFFLEDRGLP
jgi:hypothetical protein